VRPASRAVLAAGVAALAVWARPPAVAAQVAPAPATTGVLLDVDGCGLAVAADTRRIVGIELGGLLLPPAAPPEQRAGADHLNVSCAGGAAELAATGSTGTGAIRRTVGLVDLPGDVAARALALAGIEMLAALSPAVRARVEARAADQPAVTVVASPPPPKVSPAPATRVSVLGVWRTFSSGGRLVGWGGRVDVERRVRGRWGLAADVEVVGGGASSSLGEARGELASLGGRWEAGARGAHWTGAVGLGGRVGLARFVGTPTPGSGIVAGEVVRPWAGPAVSGRASLGGRSIGLALVAEAGYAIRGAQGLSGGDVLLAASGAWLALGLGVVF
jgi:hypothetical protein